MSSEPPIGWWQASDGRHYPPEAHPGYARFVEEAQRTTVDQEVSTPRFGSLAPWTIVSVAVSGLLLISTLALPGAYPLIALVLAIGALTRAFFSAIDRGVGLGQPMAALGVFAIMGVTSFMVIADSLVPERPQRNSFGESRPYVVLARMVMETVQKSRSEVLASTSVRWTSLEVGECVNWLDGGAAQSTRCDERHEAEIVGSGTFEASSEETAGLGDDAADDYWDSKARTLCEDLARDYLDPNAPDSLMLYQGRTSSFRSPVRFVCAVSDESGFIDRSFRASD